MRQVPHSTVREVIGLVVVMTCMSGCATYPGYRAIEEAYAYKIARLLETEQYAFVNYEIRELKWDGEISKETRESYLQALRVIRNSLPENADMESLPFDLRCDDEARILYGLCCFGYPSRLVGDDRAVELARVIEEIALARESDSDLAVSFYNTKVYSMVGNGVLSRDEAERIFSAAGDAGEYFLVKIRRSP